MEVHDFFPTFSYIQRLERQPRSGWHQSGIRNPENVASHTYGVAMVAMWLSDYLIERGEVIDVERVLRMALLHDIGEAITTDLPKPLKETISQIDEVERDAQTRILSNAPLEWKSNLEGYNVRGCIESRIVKSADGLQMMLMALQYERESRLNLDDFFKQGRVEFGVVAELGSMIRELRSEK